MKGQPYAVYGLRETYMDLGTYEIKIVLNPHIFKNSHDSTITLVDSDGKDIPLQVRKWGRKMNCSFVLSESVADGVAVGKFEAKGEDGGVHLGRLSFWICK